ncbi:DUF928 domain-containing protein [Pseudanabaena sp. Chao 1811]|uniref:DUF928 domain-containing protein n=1 Tax=Pseudanabaena sp. Chao 1811 TaxID=2963092 RepID=UPI0022F3A14D|nr:DUF928 domain-containing protein [Pseudanabaena sp. Chao 1811]
MKIKATIPSIRLFTIANKRRSRTYLGRASLILLCSLVSIGTGELIPLAAIAKPLLLAQSNNKGYGLGLPKSASTGGGTRLVNRDSLEIDENASTTQPRRGVIPSVRSRDRSPALLMRQLQPQPLLTLITPEDGGRTANAQPTLYWYLYDQPKQRSSSTNDLEHHVNETDETTHTTESQDCFVGQLRVILTKDQKDTTIIFQTKLTMKSGLSSFKLPIAASLQPSKSYRWEITLPDQQNELEEDVIVSGWIVYSPPESSLQKSLMRALTTRDRAKIYAEAGYWFEAIDDYTRWLKLNPNDLKTRSARNEILKSGFATNKNLDIDAFIGLLNTDAPKSSVK